MNLYMTPKKMNDYVWLWRNMTTQKRWVTNKLVLWPRRIECKNPEFESMAGKLFRA